MIVNEAVINEIVSGMSNIESDGTDQVEAMVTIWVNAIMNHIKASAEIKVDNQGGSCTYSGGHPPVHSEGKIY